MTLPSQVPTLRGDGSVVLRPFRDEDVQLVVAAASDPLIPLVTTVPRSGSEADARAYIDRQHQRLGEGEGYSFAVESARTGRAVGQIGLWTRDLAHGRASTGYWIAAEHRRRGYGRAALSALTAWAMGLEEVQRLQLYVEPRNEASWRTAAACGFAREGLLRSWQQVGAERRDMYVYSIVRS
ncbi:GNAT family N-acetyltransferase [Pedococcus sp. NPDC057267]|uniref:GNAT family N-acetyltransferase n=1 Tax=Pedococcus sp. NPDC057267 TaxID=3346077 RepID=UPI00362763EC